MIRPLYLFLAFAPSRFSRVRGFTSPATFLTPGTVLRVPFGIIRPSRDVRSIHFSSNNEDDESFFSKLKNVIPFTNKNKSKSKTVKKQVKDELSTSIDRLLKDAPLGVKVLGKMIAPLLGSAVSNIAEAVAEQGRLMEDLQSEARTYLVSDPRVLELIGEPIELGVPLSQSSSISTINGVKTTRVNTNFEVRGRWGSGMVAMEATEKGIERLSLNTDGKNIDITLSKSANVGYNANYSSGSTSNNKSGGTLGKNRNIGKDDIIDVEFEEKK